MLKEYNQLSRSQYIQNQKSGNGEIWRKSVKQFYSKKDHLAKDKDQDRKNAIETRKILGF